MAGKGSRARVSGPHASGARAGGRVRGRRARRPDRARRRLHHGPAAHLPLPHVAARRAGDLARRAPAAGRYPLGAAVLARRARRRPGRGVGRRRLPGRRLRGRRARAAPRRCGAPARVRALPDRRGARPAAALTPPRMSFVARLRPELIRVAPPWRTFEETIAGLVAVLAGERLLSAAAAPSAIQAVTAREAASSTALLDIHASVPHARLPGITQPVAALATSPHGLYEAVPTVPIQVVALVLSPPTATAQHLTILAGIATLLRSPELRAGLLGARDGHEALRILRAHAGPSRRP